MPDWSGWAVIYAPVPRHRDAGRKAVSAKTSLAAAVLLVPLRSLSSWPLFSLSMGPRWPPDLSKVHAIDWETTKKNWPRQNRTDLHFNATLMARHLEEKGIFVGAWREVCKTIYSPRSLECPVPSWLSTPCDAHCSEGEPFITSCSQRYVSLNLEVAYATNTKQTLERGRAFSLHHFLLRLAGRHCLKLTKWSVVIKTTTAVTAATNALYIIDDRSHHNLSLCSSSAMRSHFKTTPRMLACVCVFTCDLSAESCPLCLNTIQRIANSYHWVLFSASIKVVAGIKG